MIVTGLESIGFKYGPALVKLIASRLWRRLRPDISRAALIGYADNLADAVDRKETDLLDQLRGGPDMVVDDLEFRAERRLKLASGDATGVLADIGPYFRRQETRRMVVLGEAGAGKTVLAVRFVLDQLGHRADLTDSARTGEPVPVRVNAAGWDGSADFTAWLADQLAIDYGLNPRVAQAMVDTGRILPVLDGLAEMDPPGANAVLAWAVLDRLNEPPWRNRAVVVACRTKVYARIRELRGDAGLFGATTVTLHGFSAADICNYLEQYRDARGIADAAWAPVTDQLVHAPDGALATALSTPWLLSLAATALRRGRHERAVALAACRDTSEIRDKLFESLIPAAVEATRHTGRTQTYNEQNVQRWLCTLARHLEHRRTERSGGPQIALDEIWQLAGPRICIALHDFLGALIVALVVAALQFGAIRLGRVPAVVESLRTVGVLWPSIVSGLVFFGIQLFRAIVGQRRARTAKRFAWRVPGRSRWRRGLVRGLAFGLPVCLVIAVLLIAILGIPTLRNNIFGILEVPTAGSQQVACKPEFGEIAIAFALSLGLAFGLGIGLRSGLETNSEERLALGQHAERLIHDDLVSGLIIGLIWLAIGLTVGPPLSLDIWRESNCDAPVLDAVQKDWHHWLPDGLLLGLLFGLISAVMWASLSAVASGRNAIASLLFGQCGIFPRRPARFLEWGCDTGLLRVVGVAYQFRHDTYQQWLAGGGRNRNVV